MFEFLLIRIYLWIRPLLKWVLRRTTRLCELRRVCYGECKGASRVIRVEYSLRNSRSADIQRAVKILDSKSSDRALNEDAIVYGIYTINRIKSVKPNLHKKFTPILAECMTHIWGYNQLVAEVEETRKILYNSDDKEHEEQLLKLWTLLMPETTLKDRVSKQWQDIGFQGDDPKTDFRGMGVLGLENLLFFAEKHNSAARNVLLRSQHPKYGYSFAIVGINMTSLAYNLVKDSSAKCHFYNLSRPPADMQQFNNFYCYLFVNFDALWRQEKPKDIMEFSRIKTKFEEGIRLKLKDERTIFKCDFVLENV